MKAGYRRAQNFQGRTNFVVLEPSVKVFSTKFGRTVPSDDRLKHCVKVFSVKWSKFSPRNGHFLPIHERFLLPTMQYVIYTTEISCLLHVHVIITKGY